jgi:hypothetical protein
MSAHATIARVLPPRLAPAAPRSPVAAEPATVPLRPRPPVAPASVLGHLLALLVAHRSACRQTRPFVRLVVLSLAHLVTLGRHTITGLLLTLGLTDSDWSGFHRLFRLPRLDPRTLSCTLIRETLAHVPAGDPYVVALDGTHLPRSSHKMPGSGWARCPRTPPFRAGIERAQRVVGVSWLVPPNPAGYSRAIPLALADAFPPKAVRPDGVEPRTEWQAGLAELVALRQTLDAAGRTTQPILAVGDANYATTAIWAALGGDPLLAGRVALLARTRRNRALFELPPVVPADQRRRGAPRLYGEQARHPEAWLRERQGWTRTTITARGRQIRLTYRVEGPYRLKGAAAQPVFLLVVKGVAATARHKRREPTFLLVSAVQQGAAWVLPWPAPELLECAWQRWEVEVGHREWKSDFGVGEIQSWAWPAPLVAAQWQVWLYGVVLLAGYRAWGIGPAPDGVAPPTGGWRRRAGRWPLTTLLAALRHELAEAGILPEYRVGWSWTTRMWAEMLDWIEQDDPFGLGLAAD